MLLAKAKKPEELAARRQPARRPASASSLQAEDFDDVLWPAMLRAGASFEELPRHEALWQRCVVFRDLYGNRWDLIEPEINAS